MLQDWDLTLWFRWLVISTLLLLGRVSGQDVPPKPEPSSGTTRSQPEGPTERERLLRILSGAHTGGPNKVALSPLIRKLKPFLASSDEAVRQLASQGVELGVLGLLIEQQSDFRGATRALLIEGVRLAVEHPPEEGTLVTMKEAAAAAAEPGSAFDMLVSQMREMLRTGDEIQKCFNRMRKSVRSLVDLEGLEALGAKDLAFKVTPVADRNGITTSSDMQLTVQNNSGRTLHSMTVIVDVVMDDRLVDAAIRAERARWAQADPYVPEELRELQAENLANALSYYERLRLGYGTMVHVPALVAGSSVKLPFASAGDIDHVVDSVRLLVVVDDERRHRDSLDVPAMRKAIEEAVKRQQARRPGPPRRRE